MLSPVREKSRNSSWAYCLAAVSAVLVEIYRPETLAKYGLSYKDMKTINPRLIYCSISGFGQTAQRRLGPGLAKRDRGQRAPATHGAGGPQRRW